MKTTKIIFEPLNENNSYSETLETIEEILAKESSSKKYSHEEIKSIINNSFDEGYSKGKQEIDREKLHYKEVLAHAINNITTKIEELQPIISEVTLKSSQELLNFSFVIVKKILGDFLDENYKEILKVKIENCLKLVVREPVLKILISNEVEKYITDEISSIKKNTSFLGEIKIIADPNLHKLSCIVEWEDGFAKIDYNELLTRVEEIISSDI